MSAATLAVELLTEELPPKALKRLGETFAEGLRAGLAERGFLQAASKTNGYATPRRLAVTITDVLARSKDQAVKERLMPASVALDAAGLPTQALRRKLEAAGRVTLADLWPKQPPGIERLSREGVGKADSIYLSRVAAGQALQHGLQDALAATIEHLPIPKVMTYQRDNVTVRFVRPARRLLALYGAEVVPVEALGLKAGRMSAGHRFLARQDLAIAAAGAYEETLQAEGKVVPAFGERRARIVAALHAAAGTGGSVIMPDALVDEVTALVEWPAVYAGTFDAAFLAVPQECLILTMQQNQKYFALADAGGALLNRFLLVSNLEAADASAIIEGNERVLRARLSDAKFFYDLDRKQRLADRLPKLAAIVYHHKLGTLAQRSDRIARLAGAIAPRIDADRVQAERAAHLAKADLVTGMVGEFPELQGLMGRNYAEHDGEPQPVADAIEQHYWPRFAGDALPRQGVAQAVALADKLEAMAGMFGIGAQPTGDRDPFGLRRAALGVLRILIEGQLALPLDELVRVAFATFDAVPGVQQADTALEDFIHERLRGYLRDLGYTANQVAAVMDSRPADVHRVPARLAAVQAFEALAEAPALAAANKRIVNILRKSGAEAAAAVDSTQLGEGAEQDLHRVFQTLEPLVAARCVAGDYTDALRALATAKPAVDHFFDEVMVMADDPRVRANRLALLRAVATTMNRVADLSKLAV